jgi:hypothetical protein
MAAEPFVFSDSVKRAMAQRDAVATGMALLGMGTGFRALWVNEHKEPFPFLTPHAANDATENPQVLQEWALYMANANLAVVLPPGFACIDRDDLSIALEGIPSGTWGEQTRRGEHYLVTTPEVVPTKCALPGGAGEFLAGNHNYVVIAPSHDRRPFNPHAPILPLDPDSPIWRAVAEKTLYRSRYRSARITTRAITAVPDPAIDRLVASLLNGKFAPTVTLIVEGRWAERYQSRSHADFGLAFMATYFTDDPALIAALLAKYSRKVSDAKDPLDYLARTTRNALAERAGKTANRIEVLRHLVCRGAGTYPLIGSVRDVTPPRDLPELSDALIHFAAVSATDEYTRENRWRRVPVEDFAALYGRPRQAVWRYLSRLEKNGHIERDHYNGVSDKGHRRDSLIRLAR